MWNPMLYLRPLYFFLLLVWIGLNGIGFSDEEKYKAVSVNHCPDQTTSLIARWQWALDQFSNHPRVKHFGIGFSNDRLMDENSYTGRWPIDPKYPTLSELIYSIRMEIPKISYSRQQESRKVNKEVAYLFELDRDSSSIEQIRMSNIILNVPMNDGVLFWLGKVGQEQSLSLMQKIYDELDDDHLKRNLVRYIGDLQLPQVISFLDSVLNKEKTVEVRNEAVEELGNHHSQEALDILLRTVRQDSSDHVRRKAVESIQNLELPNAEQALIDIAQNGPSISVREEAIEQLGNKSIRKLDSSSKVIQCLMNMIYKKDELENIRRKALETLFQIENHEALGMLIRIAENHFEPWVRQEAMEEMRNQSFRNKNNTPAIISSLVNIINKKEDLEKVRWTALECLTQIENGEALNQLIRIAETHFDCRMRQEAMEEMRNQSFRNKNNTFAIISSLVNIINKKEDLEKVRWTALECLTQIENGEALNQLIRIAETHFDCRMRQEAMEELKNKSFRKENNITAIIESLVNIINKKNELENVQRKALDVLAQMENKKTPEVLIRIAKTHPKLWIRRIAIDYLRDRISPEIKMDLENVIENQEEQEKIDLRKVEALARAENKAALDMVIRMAETHANPRVRKEAVNELRDHDSSEVIKCWLNVINKQDELEEIQREALDRLSDIETKEGMDLIVQIADAHPDSRIREEAIDKLRENVSPKIISYLINIINKPEELEKIQRKALDRLGDMETEDVSDWLLQIANTHPDWKIREEAIDKLRENKSPKVIQCLVNIINKQGELEKIPWKALERLTDIDMEEAQDMVIRIVETHPDSRIRREAIEKLRNNPSSKVIKELVSIINKQDELEDIQRKALETLTQMEDEKALDISIQIAKTHPDSRMRREAIDQLRDKHSTSLKFRGCLMSIIDNPAELEENQLEALKQLKEIGHQDVLNYLEYIVKIHPNRTIRNEAQKIIIESWRS